jgi:hypothetical protein
VPWEINSRVAVSAGRCASWRTVNRNRWRGAIAKVAANSGAPVSVFVAFKRADYIVTKGEITRFYSSPRRLRGFCARCGSTLTCEGERSPPETHFHVGAFDQPARFQPTRHISPEERLPWLDLSDYSKLRPSDACDAC